jgi:opacity protein-like surface antigen
MKILSTAAAAAALVISASSFAAKPTSIVFKANGENSEGTAYATYMVKCSNGQKKELTAWNNRRNWCVGNAESQDCYGRGQIKAAKAACK